MSETTAAEESQKEESPDPAKRNRSRKKVLAWVGGIATAFVVAIAAALGSGVGNDLFSSVSSGPTGPLVKVAQVSIERTAGQAGTFVFAKNELFSAAQLAQLNGLAGNDNAYNQWFRTRGGVDPEVSMIKLVVVGNQKQPVAITGMSVNKHCGKALGGTLFYSPSAGEEFTVGVGFNLDSSDPNAQNYNNGRVSGDFFAQHFVSLNDGEIETFTITAVTKMFCQFTINLQAVDGGSTQTEVVRDGSHPFSVTGVVGSPTYIGPGALSYYHVLYVGGVASSNGQFIREDPKTYNNGETVG